MNDHELKEKMMREMLADMFEFYAGDYDSSDKELADHLIRAGWRKP